MPVVPRVVHFSDAGSIPAVSTILPLFLAILMPEKYVV